MHLWLFFLGVFAQTTTIAVNSYTLTIPTIITAVLCIVGGFITLCFGHRLFRPTMFIAGVFFGCIIGYAILIKCEPSSGYNNRDLVLFLGSLAFGIVMGFLASCLWQLGVTLIGALGGFTLAVWILSFQTKGAISSETGRAIFIAVFALVGAILAHLFEKPAIILSTSLFGSYFIVFGIDLFVHSGFDAALREFLSGQASIYVFETNAKLYGLAATMIILAIAGAIIQFRSEKGRNFKNF